MNWVLVLMLTYSSGATSQQIGPYVSQADCLKALAVAESQDTKENYVGIYGFCVPKPKGKVDSGYTNTQSMPKEFD
jgi:hypothetical protein